MKTLTLVFLIVASFGIRFVRWLAWFQQKEYRFDRLWLFVISPEGMAELFRLIPQKNDFSKTGLKRPQKTPRIIVTALLSVCLIALIFYLAAIRGCATLLVVILLVYLLLPGIMFLVNLSAMLVKHFVTQYYLQQARQLIRKYRPQIIGITGSYGKTTTKLLLARVLASKAPVFTTPASYNTKYSVAKSICDKYRGEKLVVLEYGAYTRGEIEQLANFFPPSIAIITGLSEQHLGLFGSLEKIILAKAELIKALPKNASVYVNASDPGADQIFIAGRNLHPAGQSLKRVGYGIGDDGEWQFATQKDGFIQIMLGQKKYLTQIWGGHYVTQLSAVFLLATTLGIEPDQIAQVLRDFKPSTNFIRRYQLESGVVIIDDGGTSNPTGFETALGLISSLPATRKILLTAGIVDLGQRSAEIHQNLARAAGRSVSEVWYLGEIGKSEFINELGQRIVHQRDQIKLRIKQLTKEDLLLVEGRMPKWLKL